VEPRDGFLEAATIQQRLEQVPGVSRVVLKQSRDNLHRFEAEGLPGQAIRGELARAVVNAGWNLNELSSAAAQSLEEVFLQLTGSEEAAPPAVAKDEAALAGKTL